MKSLFLIPARGGSVSIPLKNIKLLGGRPLITYTIDAARKLVSDSDICVSTDSQEIIRLVESYGLRVPFRRPDNLATSNATSESVILHAIKYYQQISVHYETIVLLQPTSPFRNEKEILKCIDLYTRGNYDMVVSVKTAGTNPYYNCFQDSGDGFLKKVIQNVSLSRRQDAPTVYEFNGAVYVINVASILSTSIKEFSKIGYCVMDRLHSIDIDDNIDWNFAEFLLREKCIML